MSGRNDAEAGGAAERKLQKNKGQNSDVVDTGHLPRGQHLTADHGIRQLVNLLQQVGKHNGSPIAQHAFIGDTRGQIDRLPPVLKP